MLLSLAACRAEKQTITSDAALVTHGENTDAYWDGNSYYLKSGALLPRLSSVKTLLSGVVRLEN
jgi:hypothetical protein